MGGQLLLLLCAGAVTEANACDLPAPTCLSQFAEEPGLGYGFAGPCYTGIKIPTPGLAVGPDHVVAIVNGAVTFHDESGALLYSAPTVGRGGFWENVDAGRRVSDPRALYDPISQRFFVSSMDPGEDGDGRSFLLLAVSDDDHPCGLWHKYRLEMTKLAGEVFDQPQIGVDSVAFYAVGITKFGGVPLFIYDKASLLSGAEPVIQNSLYLPVQSARIAGLPPIAHEPALGKYFLAHFDGFGVPRTQVQLLAITDPLGTPIAHSTLLSVASYFNPAACVVPQPSPGDYFDITVNNAFLSTDYRNGSLWATHNVQKPGDPRVLSRWLEIQTNGWPLGGGSPVVAQQGWLDDGFGVHSTHPSIAAGADGTVAMTYTRSSASEQLTICSAWRRSIDPPGTMPYRAVRKVSEALYNTDDFFCSRLGDYSITVADPCRLGRFWGHHNFSPTPPEWRTWICALDTADLSLLSDLNGDGEVNGADIGILLSAWGTSCCGCPPDINGDGVVDGGDLGMILDQWGPSCFGCG